MQFWLASLLGGLVQVAGSLVGRVLVSLGIGYVVFTGVEASVDFVRDFLVARIGQLPGQAIAVASQLKIGVCISILSSALVARLVLNGLNSGAITRMVQR